MDTLIEPGYCRCGCGQKTNLAPQTHRKKGWVKGQPLPYLIGHASRREPPQDSLERYINQEWKHPRGLCQCGCGQKTALATKTQPERGTVKGQPLRYISSHHIKRHDRVAMTEQYYRAENWRYPPGICQCGCGQTTEPIASDRPWDGLLKGFPQKWVKGHGTSYYAINPEITYGYKQCPDCSEPKPLSHFECAPSGTYFSYCREHSRAGGNQKKEVAILAARKHHLASKYGLTMDQYESLLTSQNGVCAICKKLETSIHAKTGQVCRLSVDHDETAGAIRVRGLLCKPCNQALGLLKHDIALLRSAIAYLKND